MSFEWAEAKASANLREHGVSFEEASTVFDDPLGSIFADELHSGAEPRELLMGRSARGRLLLVCFTERRAVIRIISARAATKRERKDYEENVTARFIGD